MSLGIRSPSSLMLCLVVGLLCVGSYVLGLKHGVERVEATAGGQAVGSDIAMADPLPKADRDRPSPFDDQKAGARPADEIASADAGRTEIETSQKQRLMRNLSANLEQPGMNRIIQEQQRVLVESQFRDLIETLGLNEKEREYLLDLLTARQMYHVEMGMKLMTGMLSEGERNELLARVGSGIDEMNKEIDWFLNNATDSEYFDYYERTEGERAIVNSVSDRLSQSGHPLDSGLDMELIAIMHEKISAYPFSVEFEQNGEPVFSRFTEANIDTFIRELQTLRQSVMAEAAKVLDADQLEVFSGSFDQYVTFYDQRMRMVQQLFNPVQ